MKFDVTNHQLGTAPVVFPLTPVGFEPTQLALVELESTPLDHSGKVSLATAGCKAIRNVQPGFVMVTGYYRCHIERKAPSGQEHMVC